ncbi:MAG: hypothetical protein HWE25_16835 [Alphaproteobacteria bacterium]|nr:hypothetical protein [Alphaproteobacteria bacterium]
MNYKTLFSTAMITAISLSTGAVSDEEDKMTRGEKRLAKIMEDYKPTGETKSCVSLRFLRDSRIIDDKTIFFKGVGKRAYMNKMSHQCNGLEREERFMYSTSIAQLCRNEIITVLDSFGRQWGSCGLGDFEEYAKKSADEKAAEKSESN